MAASEQRGLADRLAALGSSAVRHDNRGMGASDRDVGEWRLEARVRDREAIVAKLGLTRFALAGVDERAPAAIAYASKHPAAVSHLVLICPWRMARAVMRIAGSIRGSMSAEGLSAYVGASRTMDVRDMLSRTAAPTLVIHEPSFPSR